MCAAGLATSAQPWPWAWFPHWAVPFPFKAGNILSPLSEPPDTELPPPAAPVLRVSAWELKGQFWNVYILNLCSCSSPWKASAGSSVSPTFCASTRVGFYGFNLNKGFLISCLRSCQSEKFLYYMRLKVFELSRLHNTQHHYPSCPLSLSAGALQDPGATCVTASSLPAYFPSNFTGIFKLQQASASSW